MRLVKWAAASLLCAAAACDGAASNDGLVGPGGEGSVVTVEVSPPAATLVTGHTAQLAAIARDRDGRSLSNVAIAWASSNSAVALVSESGVVTAVNPGNSSIKATANGVEGSATIAVSDEPPVPVALVSVNPASASLTIGATQQLSATLFDANGAVLTGRAVTWSTSNSSVATVGSNGQVTAVATGDAVVSATSEGKSGTSAIHVAGPTSNPIASVLVAPQSATIDAINQTLQLSATARDVSGNVVAGASFTWRSVDPTIATVAADGKVTSRKVGAVLIIAAAAAVADTASITVRQIPTSLTVTPATVGVLVGSSVQLQGTVKDAGGTAIPNSSVTWGTSAPGIASVSTSGLVAGVAEGSATVTATSGTLSAQSQISVLTPGSGPSGIWISRDELMTRPTSGAAWDALYADAASNPGTADVSNQDSNHDIIILAAALVCVRTNEFCDKARQGVVAAIGTEQGGRWLAVGRNMTAYVIAADLLGLRATADPTSDGSRVHVWIASFLTMNLAHNNTGEPWPLSPFESGSNASAQEGAVYAAVGAYLNNRTALDRVWAAFRTYTCDPGAPDTENIDLGAGIAAGWSHDDAHPCAINPLGTVKTIPAGVPGAGTSRRLDGSIINDMRRGGDYQWPPVYTSYPWVGLEGAVAAAVLLHRAGYPAFEIADRAMLRTHEYLWYLREGTGNVDWFDGRRADEVVFLINQVYGKSFPTASGVGGGRTFGYTDWSHMTWR